MATNNLKISEPQLFNEFKNKYDKNNWQAINEKHATIISILANQVYLKPEDYLVQRTIEKYIDLINTYFYTINHNMIIRLAASIQNDPELCIELENYSTGLHQLLYQALIIFAKNYQN